MACPSGARRADPPASANLYFKISKNMKKLIFYLPRVLAVLFIIFVSVFALDVFEMEATFWQKLAGFLIHLIPSFLLIIATIVAWKKEFIGGIIFIALGVLAAFWTNDIFISLPIILPPFVIGILFLIAGRHRRI